MNKFTRKELETIKSELKDINLRISDIENEEQDKFDNLPENLQNSEMGERISVCVNNMQDIQGFIDDAISSIDDTLNY